MPAIQGIAAGIASSLISGLFLLRSTKKNSEVERLRSKLSESLLNIQAYRRLEEILLMEIKKSKKNQSVTALRRTYRDQVRAYGMNWTSASSPAAIATELILLGGK